MASAAMAQIFFAPLANVRGTSITKVKINLRIILYFSHLSVPLGLRKEKA